MNNIEAVPTEGSANPPQRIRIALSGGGYRAAAFHLGTIDYLNRVGLRTAINAISSVSGGTILGAAYSVALVEKTPFQEFFKDFYRKLRDVPLVELCLERLTRQAMSVPSGRQDLIVAMSEVYSEQFFRRPEPKADEKSYNFGTILNSETGHLDEIIFNATEFRHGLAFRFQKSATGRIGNFYFAVPRIDAAKIRLADIVAASSCFPGGFEPLAFPDDFHWPGEQIPEATKAVIYDTKDHNPVALMDGGIYDNQGIEGLLLADDREKTIPDAFIISDVDQYSDNYYTVPRPVDQGGPRLSTISLIAWLVWVACLLTVALTAADAWKQYHNEGISPWDLFRYIVPLCLAGATAFGLWRVRITLLREVRKIPNVNRATWSELKRLRIGQISDMLRLRATSLVTMATSIFMARVRALGYNAVYKNKDYNKKRISNLVYHLQTGRKFQFQSWPDVPNPSKELLRVVDAAASMPTTLWFDKDYQEPCLVATGQATICYNLMKFVARNYGNEPSEYPEAIKELWDRLLSDWVKFVNEPYVFLRERLPGEILEPPPETSPE